MKKSWVKISFLYLVIVALLGLFLRLLFFFPVEGVNFKYFLHAHSHVALLGWLYSAFFIALLFSFLNKEDRNRKTFKIQFWLSQATVVGMLISFPLQGYAAASITFSSLHILLSYWFIYSFSYYSRRNEKLSSTHSFSLGFIKWSLFFMALSSIGPWAMAPIMATENSGSHLYYLAIYFYLHFQYNGWFTFAVFGLFFWWLEKKNIPLPRKESKYFFLSMVISCIPAYALSTLWTQPPPWVYFIGGMSGFVQLFGLFRLLRLLWKIRAALKKEIYGMASFLMILALVSLTIKLILQLASSFPYIADLAYKIRHFVIGYLHLTLIGFVTFFIFAFFQLTGLINFENRQSKTGLSLFITGFVLSEAILFLQGTMYWLLFGNIPYYYELLFGVSVLMPVGLGLFVLNCDEENHLEL